MKFVEKFSILKYQLSNWPEGIENLKRLHLVYNNQTGSQIALKY